MIILRLPEVKRILGHRSDASVYNAIRSGLLPTGVAIGQRARGWPDHEIDLINMARVAGRSEEQIRQLVRRLQVQRLHLDGVTL